MGCYAETNALALTGEASAYVGHITFSLMLLYCSVVSPKIRKALPWVVIMTFVTVAFSILFQTNGYFKDAVVNAQVCAQPEGMDLVWVDDSTKWLFNIPFAVIWISAAMYGLAGAFEPGTFLRFEFPADPETANAGWFRGLCLLPAVGTVYAALLLLGGGSLIKPLPQRLFPFEVPLASTLTVSGLCWLPLALYGAGLAKRRAWSQSILSFRPLAIMVGFSACYYCIWRLNGGLVLFPSQFGTESAFRLQLQRGAWQHVGPLKEFAASLVESVGSL